MGFVMPSHFYTREHYENWCKHRGLKPGLIVKSMRKATKADKRTENYYKVFPVYAGIALVLGVMMILITIMAIAFTGGKW